MRDALSYSRLMNVLHHMKRFFILLAYENLDVNWSHPRSNQGAQTNIRRQSRSEVFIKQQFWTAPINVTNVTINPISTSLFELISKPGGGPKYLGVGWVYVCNSFWKWLVLEWFTIFKSIHQVLMPRTFKNNVWLLKCFVGPEPFVPVCKVPPLKIWYFWQKGVKSTLPLSKLIFGNSQVFSARFYVYLHN